MSSIWMASRKRSLQFLCPYKFPISFFINNTTPAANQQEAIIREDNVKQIRKRAGEIPVLEFDFCEVITKERMQLAGSELAALLS